MSDQQLLWMQYPQGGKYGEQLPNHFDKNAQCPPPTERAIEYKDKFLRLLPDDVHAPEETVSLMHGCLIRWEWGDMRGCSIRFLDCGAVIVCCRPTWGNPINGMFQFDYEIPTGLLGNIRYGQELYEKHRPKPGPSSPPAQ